MSRSFAKKQKDRKMSRDYLSLLDDIRALKRAAKDVVHAHDEGEIAIEPGGSFAINQLRHVLERLER